MVEERAEGGIEDGLGADGLRCSHLGRPGAPVTAPEYSRAVPRVLMEACAVTRE